MMNRRSFISTSLLSTGALLQMPYPSLVPPKLKISLAQWSLHRALESGKIVNMEFAALARKKFDIGAIEYVNQFFKTTTMDAKQAATNPKYLSELLLRSKDVGVYNHLIMIDDEGSLASPDGAQRSLAVENHKPWIDAAKYLGCATVRVNLHGAGTSTDKHHASVDSLGKLGEYAAPMGINVVVENHGNKSSNGKWLAAIMKEINKPNVGTLPDFGNFCLSDPWGQTQDPCTDEYDRYQGVTEMLPFAKGVSAKSYDFDAKGNQPKINYERMIGILKKSGFSGYIGIEYEGYTGDEEEGIRLTKKLLAKYLY